MCLTRTTIDMFADPISFSISPRLINAFACLLTLVLFFCSSAVSAQSALIELDKPLEHEQKQELADHALHILGGNANVIARWIGGIRVALVSEPSPVISDHVKKTMWNCPSGEGNTIFRYVKLTTLVSVPTFLY